MISPWLDYTQSLGAKRRRRRRARTGSGCNTGVSVVSSRLGIGILDLLPQTTALAPSIPDGVVEALGVLTVVDHRCTSSADFFLHEGVLQSAADALDLSTENWPIHIPGLIQGLPFRLAVARDTAPAGQQEPRPSRWILDIEVTDLEVQIPGVRAAQRSGGSGVTPLTLAPAGDSDASRRVYLAGSTVIRISGGGAGGAQVELADTPDPLDPDAPTGAVIHLTAKPPDFLFGSSQYGLTLDSFDIDLSTGYTPAAIMARGHDETWKGVAFRDATFFFPPSTPLVHSLSVGVRDVIIGSPGGLQGQLSVEFGQDFADVPNTRITIQLQTSSSPTTLATSAGVSATSLVCPVSTVAFGQTRRVRAVFNVDAPTTIPGHTDLAIVGVYWKLPDGSEGNSTTTPWFTAPVDGTLNYRLRMGGPTNTATATPPSQVPADQTELVEVSVTFPRQEGSPTGTPPIVDLTVAGSPTMNNALHLRGGRASLAGLVFQARNAETADWLLGAGTAPHMVRHATSFSTPLLPDGTTTADLLVEGANGARRIRLDVVPGGPLVVGHQASADPASTGVVTVIGTGAVTPNDVDATFRHGEIVQNGFQPAVEVAASYADLRFSRPVPVGGTPPAVTGTWWVCETAATGSGALPGGAVPPGGHVVLLTNPPSIVDRNTIPAAAWAANTLRGKLLTTDIVSLTAPSFQSTPDRADPIGRPLPRQPATGGDPKGGLEAIVGAKLHYLPRIPAALAASSAPYALLDRLDVAAASVSGTTAHAAIGSAAPVPWSLEPAADFSFGFPGVPASIETHGVGVALTGAPAVAVTEFVRERTAGLGFSAVQGLTEPARSLAIQSEIALAAEAATALPAITDGAGAGPVAAVLRSCAFGLEGVPGIATAAITANVFPFSQQEAGLETWLNSQISAGGGAGSALRSAAGTFTDGIARALDRRILSSGYGAREALTALIAAFDRAQDLVYLETPSIDMLPIESGGENLQLWSVLDLADGLAARFARGALRADSARCRHAETDAGRARPHAAGRDRPDARCIWRSLRRVLAGRRRGTLPAHRRQRGSGGRCVRTGWVDRLHHAAA